MARVEADAQPRVAVEPLDKRHELVDRAPDRGAGAGRVLDQQPGVAVAALEDLGQRRDRAVEAGLETRPEVRADVEDDPVRADRGRRVDGAAHRPDRLLVDLVVGRGEIAEVERVADDAADARFGATLAELRDCLRLVLGRPPHPRALREHLHAVAADRLDAVDGGVDPACRRDMRAEFHPSLR